MTPGYATPDGTAAFQARFDGRVHADHFAEHQGLRLSSVGLGTYLGNADDATDAAYQDAVVAAVRGGVNVLDTAVNYRFQRSERAVGAALRDLLAAGFRREELLVCTKAGFLAFDGAEPEDPKRWIEETYVKPGIAAAEEILPGGHCMTPRYLAHQIERSRANLGLETLDVFYLHNPEVQLEAVSEEVFVRRLGTAFLFLEEVARVGVIRRYGVATWDGFRTNPGTRNYLPLAAMVEVARTVGGDDHHFRAIQLPLNLAMAEAAGYPNQLVGEEARCLLDAAAHHGITVVGSAALLQGEIPVRMPDALAARIPGCTTNAQRAVQFARSAPGLATALVGMSRKEHVAENLAVAGIPKMDREAFVEIFRAEEPPPTRPPSDQPPAIEV